MLCNNGNGKGKCPALEYVHESNKFLRVFCTRYNREMGYDQNDESEAWKFKWHKIVEECDGYDRLTEPRTEEVLNPEIVYVKPEKPEKKPWYNTILHPFGGK